MPKPVTFSFMSPQNSAPSSQPLQWLSLVCPSRYSYITVIQMPCWWHWQWLLAVYKWKKGKPTPKHCLSKLQPIIESQLHLLLGNSQFSKRGLFADSFMAGWSVWHRYFPEVYLSDTLCRPVVASEHLCTWTRSDSIKLAANNHLFIYLRAVTKITLWLHRSALVNESWLYMWIGEWTFALCRDYLYHKRILCKFPLKWFFCSAQLIKLKYFLDHRARDFPKQLFFQLYFISYICICF